MEFTEKDRKDLNRMAPMLGFKGKLGDLIAYLFSNLPQKLDSDTGVADKDYEQTLLDIQD